MRCWLLRCEIKPIIGALMIAIQLAPPALAAPAQDLPDVKRDLGECSRSPVPEKSVDGCTALINSGKLKGSALSAAHFLRAVALMRSNRAAEAKEDLAEAAKLDPNSVFGLISHGFLSCDKKDTASANAAFSEVIRRAPKWSLGYVVRGICNLSLGQANEAVQDLTKALEGMINAPPQARAFVHFLRGQALAAADKSDDALRDLGKALQMDSHFAAQISSTRAMIYSTRARLYAGRRDWLLAAEEWGRWTALNPDVAYGFAKQGDALDYGGHSREAIAAYTKAIGLETNPKFLATHHLDRAYAYGNLEEWPKAIEDYDEAIRLAPTVKAYRGRASALITSGSGKLSDALADLRKANEIDSRDSYVVLWLAVAEAKLGNLDLEEIKVLAKGLDPKWPRDIVRVLLNERPADEPINTDGLKEMEAFGRRCELEFFVGEVRLAQGQREEGIRRLQAAIASGVKEYIEYQAAKRELKRLGIDVSASSN